MREMNLTFRNPDEVLDFVKTVEQYPFDMDLCRGSVVVDAKSLLGIMNLGFNQTRSEERRVGKECRSRWSPYH